MAALRSVNDGTCSVWSSGKVKVDEWWVWRWSEMVPAVGKNEVPGSVDDANGGR